jgi:hypothetical protein
MQHITRAFLMVVSIAALGGSACNGRSAANNQADALADRACACQDAACADKVVDEFIEFVKENAHARGDEKAAQKSGERLGQCVVKAGVDPQKFMQKLTKLQETVK